ncbi:MAG: hypothetical protein IJP48_11190 [Synergistaceae bacterium]|nr:hypothetical protein [Synergistaceae bacterium]
MRHLVIDRQIAGIIKWLERLKKSYDSGSMETALMEAECARADLEYLRQDVWDKVRPGSLSIFRRNKFLSALIAFSRPAFLALLIILLAVVPISREIPAPAVKYDRTKIVLAEPVLIIREDNTVLDINTPPAKAPVQAPAQTSLINSLIQKSEQAKLLPYDQVISLIQTSRISQTGQDANN